MILTPLVSLAALRVPALTDTFSDVLDTASMTVVAGGTSTITTAAPHGLAVGSLFGASVVDALSPNPILSWSVLDTNSAIAPERAGDVLITVGYPHALSPPLTDTDLSIFNDNQPWDSFALLSGTGIPAIDGNAQLVSVRDNNNFAVRPSGSLTLGSVPGGAKLLERLEREIIGWHAMTVSGASTLTFPTPTGVTRSYTVVTPKVAVNIRVAGGVSLIDVLKHYTRDDEANKTVLDQGFLFVTPPPQARLSRDRNARSDAMVEIQPGNFVSQLLMDGFRLYAILPAERYGGAVGCIDRANGSILTAVLRTFNGLKLPFTELSSPNPYVAFLESHGAAHYDRANYVHEYSFGCTVYLSQGDGIAPNEVPDMAALDPSGPVLSTGTTPLGAIVFPGIFQDDQPQPLQAVINLQAAAVRARTDFPQQTSLTQVATVHVVP